jgi:ubiquinol-cytochrome c reductase cytochrome c subunit
LWSLAIAVPMLICGWSSVAAMAGEGATPIMRARQDVDPRTLYESGIPRADEQPAAAGAARAADGAALYTVHCSSCHGMQLQGTPGAPSLQHAGIAAVDFYIRTGRMPLAVKVVLPNAARPSANTTQAFHAAPHLNDAQTVAIEAFIGEHGDGAPIPDVRLADAKLQRGRQLFEDNCEACHGVGGQGATVGYQWTAVPLDQATPTQIGEAIRIGPGVMPRFSAAELPPADVNALATYVRYLATTPQTYGGTLLGLLGPTAEGAVGAFIGVGFLFWVVYFTGTKADGRRLHERD